MRDLFTPRTVGLTKSSSEAGKRKSRAKTQRRWGDAPPSEVEMASLDFSTDRSESGGEKQAHDLKSLVDAASLGTRTKEGSYEVKDWDFFGSKGDVLARATAQRSSSLGALGSLFARLTVSKVLTEQDLKPILEGMKLHLMKKNVAMEIAEKICEGVGEGLVGKKLGGFQSIRLFPDDLAREISS